jgi:HSP20 family protein
MEEYERKAMTSEDRIRAEMLGLLRDPVSGERWVSARQHKIWRPPTDVYETDDSLVVKVEIAGMDEQDFTVSLSANKLVISGVRHDPAAKLGYQQMEILYGHFETAVHLARAVDVDNIEATYQNGFLDVHLPKAKPRQVPVVGRRDSS